MLFNIYIYIYMKSIKIVTKKHKKKIFRKSKHIKKSKHIRKSIKKGKKHTRKNMHGGIKLKAGKAEEMRVFTVRGHGGPPQNAERKLVPPGCILLSTTMCGTSAYISEEFDFDFIPFIFEQKSDSLKKPWEAYKFRHLDEIITQPTSNELIGNADTNEMATDIDRSKYLTIHISKEDFETTNKNEDLFTYLDNYFYFSLEWFYLNNKGLQTHPTSPLHYDEIRFCKSGLIEMDKELEPTQLIIRHNIYKHANYQCPMISDADINIIYEYSKYPTVRQVIDRKNWCCDINDQRQYLISGREHNPELISAHDFINCVDYFARSQSELFDMFKGIHYITTCRPFPYNMSMESKITMRQASTNVKDIFPEINEIDEMDAEDKDAEDNNAENNYAKRSRIENLSYTP